MYAFRVTLIIVLGALTLGAQALAQDPDPLSTTTEETGGGVFGNRAFALPGSQAAPAQTPPTRPKAIAYSDAYVLRRKIHKYASIATLPLFVGEFAIGQKLYNGNRSESWRSAHSGLATGVAVLFGVNSVTGVWNLWEGRKNPTGRSKRMIHGILMLGADAGFVATAALAPHEREGGQVQSTGRGSTHRTVALSSMGVAVFSYVYMLIAR